MLSAFFDIPSPPPPRGGSRGRAAGGGKKKQSQPQPPREPRPTEPGTTSTHARFVPLPPEINVPRPAEVGDQQPWRALAADGGRHGRDDGSFPWNHEDPADIDTATWMAEDESADADAVAGDDVSEPDFEPESLDPLAAAGAEEDASCELSGGSSYEDNFMASFFASRRGRRGGGGGGGCGQPVYSGPQLCCEEDDFD